MDVQFGMCPSSKLDSTCVHLFETTPPVGLIKDDHYVWSSTPYCSTPTIHTSWQHEHQYRYLVDLHNIVTETWGRTDRWLRDVTSVSSPSAVWSYIHHSTAHICIYRLMEKRTDSVPAEVRPPPSPPSVSSSPTPSFPTYPHPPNHHGWLTAKLRWRFWVKEGEKKEMKWGRRRSLFNTRLLPHTQPPPPEKSAPLLPPLTEARQFTAVSLSSGWTGATMLTNTEGFLESHTSQI